MCGRGAESATLKSEPTAFGVPTSSSTEKYSWLGAGGLQTEFLETGIQSSSAGAYIPQVGLHLAPQGLSGAAAQDPVNEYLADQPAAEPHQEGPETGPFPPPPSPPASVTVPPPLAPPPANEPEEEDNIDPEYGENTHGCHVWASWGSSITDELTGFVHFNCKDGSYEFEAGVQLELIISGGVEGGSYEHAGEDHEDFKKGENIGKHEAHWAFRCETGREYRLVAWGRYWYYNGYGPWWAVSVDGHSETCPAKEAEIPFLP